MKYLVIEAVEREISAPMVFETFEAAHQKMCECVAEAREVSFEDIMQSYEDGEVYDEDTCVLLNSAYTMQCGVNYDWKIFALTNTGEISYDW